MSEYFYSELTREIIAAAIEVHSHLGPGMLESAYEECLSFELENRGIKITRQAPIPVVYKDIKLECGYRADIIADGKVILE